MTTERKRCSGPVMALVAIVIVQMAFDIVFIVDRAVFRTELNAMLCQHLDVDQDKRSRSCP